MAEQRREQIINQVLNTPITSIQDFVEQEQAKGEYRGLMKFGNWLKDQINTKQAELKKQDEKPTTEPGPSDGFLGSEY